MTDLPTREQLEALSLEELALVANRLGNNSPSPALFRSRDVGRESFTAFKRRVTDAIWTRIERAQATAETVTGWDNPITPHAEKLVWVLESYSIEPVPEKKQDAVCFGCGGLLDKEQILLSFGQEGPWTYCRSCVGEAAAAFKFVHEADW